VLLVCTVYNAVQYRTVKCLYSETGPHRTHVHIHYFLLRMTDTMTSQNIDLTSWDTLCIGKLNMETSAMYDHG
jgi:hypothetical protein